MYGITMKQILGCIQMEEKLTIEWYGRTLRV